LGEPNALLSANPWYEELAGEPARRQALWREFLLGEDAKEQAVRGGDWVIGSRAFRQRMQRQGARPAPRQGGRPLQAAATIAEDVLPQVAENDNVK
jgi:hypothetical protein